MRASATREDRLGLGDLLRSAPKLGLNFCTYRQMLEAADAVGFADRTLTSATRTTTPTS
jgi:hypothetical protein